MSHLPSMPALMLPIAAITMVVLVTACSNSLRDSGSRSECASSSGSHLVASDYYNNLLFFEEVGHDFSLADERYREARAAYREWTNIDRSNLVQAFVSAPRPRGGSEEEYIALLAHFHDAGEGVATRELSATTVIVTEGDQTKEQGLLDWLRSISGNEKIEDTWLEMASICSYADDANSDRVIVRVGD